MTKVNRTFRIDRKLSDALDKLYKRHGDNTYHIECAMAQYAPIKAIITDKPIVNVGTASHIDHGVLVVEPTADALFDRVWELYGRKGNKKTSRLRFNKLAKESKKAVWDHMPAYVLSTPDKQYRKNLETYINQECWNDEIVTTNQPVKTQADSVYLLLDRSWADGMTEGTIIEHKD